MSEIPFVMNDNERTKKNEEDANNHFPWRDQTIPSTKTEFRIRIHCDRFGAREIDANKQSKIFRSEIVYIWFSAKI